MDEALGRPGVERGAPAGARVLADRNAAPRRGRSAAPGLVLRVRRAALAAGAGTDPAVLARTGGGARGVDGAGLAGPSGSSRDAIGARATPLGERHRTGT